MERQKEAQWEIVYNNTVSMMGGVLHSIYLLIYLLYSVILNSSVYLFICI